jgi:iron(III) transport system substrate-binding protein
MLKILLLLTSLFIISCQEKKNENALWIYTSMYKDTIADLTPQLEKDFPDVTFHWFQAGSEEIASKVNAEILAGGIKADILISSDRFWYEEMAKNKKLHPYQSPNAQTVPASLKNDQGHYTTVSIPVMVLTYNSEVMSAEDAPKTFKEMSTDKWKGKFTTGSPLSSGTNFTTMAMLQHHYGWDYFQKLKANETIAQGGNSAVIRRLQNKERQVGWVLLENLLRFQGKDERLKAIFPDDGVVTHANVMAITKKEGKRDLAQKFVDWMFTEKGQKAMTSSYMYSPLPSFAPPKGAPKLEKVLSKSFPWTKEFLDKVTTTRADLKEKYTEIMFQ